MKILRTKINTLSNRFRLRYKYIQSQKELRRCIASVHSSTLDELYTERYKLHTKIPNCTTVKNLETQQPEIVQMTSEINSGTKETNHNEIYSLHTIDGLFLGLKRFAVILKNGIPNFFGFGCIESTQHDKYAGTQIRLLQATCELAKKFGVKEMSIDSLLQATIFHTMMGFRPDKSYNYRIMSVADLKKYNEILKSQWKDYIRAEFYTPIISKNHYGYFIDANRTLYCSSLKQNIEGIKKTHQRYIIYTPNVWEDTILMTLKGKELEKWFKRLKGFEILPQDKK